MLWVFLCYTLPYPQFSLKNEFTHPMGWFSLVIWPLQRHQFQSTSLPSSPSPQKFMGVETGEIKGEFSGGGRVLLSTFLIHLLFHAWLFLNFLSLHCTVLQKRTGPFPIDDSYILLNKGPVLPIWRTKPIFPLILTYLLALSSSLPVRGGGGVGEVPC